MDKIKGIVKLALLIIFLIFIGIFVIKLLPLFIIFFIAYLVVNKFKSAEELKQDEIVTKKVKKSKKDMSNIDLAMHMSEKINKNEKM